MPAQDRQLVAKGHWADAVTNWPARLSEVAYSLLVLSKIGSGLRAWGMNVANCAVCLRPLLLLPARSPSFCVA